jgi:hypothetical protein
MAICSRRNNYGIPVERDSVLNIGDRVKVKDIDWFNSLSADDYGDKILDINRNYLFTVEMKPLLGKVLEVSSVKTDSFGDTVYLMEYIKGFEMDQSLLFNTRFVNEMFESIVEYGDK